MAIAFANGKAAQIYKSMVNLGFKTRGTHNCSTARTRETRSFSDVLSVFGAGSDPSLTVYTLDAPMALSQSCRTFQWKIQRWSIEQLELLWMDEV